MKGRSLLSFSLILTVLGAGLLTKSQQLTAEPAPVFRPILNDIRRQLPRDMEIRLPASLPSFNWLQISRAISDTPPNNKIYPYIESNDGFLGVNLGITPSCALSASPDSCAIGGISVFKSREPKFWPPKGQNLTPVDLSNGVRGFYFTRGEGINTLRFVFWRQDGLTFGLGGPAFAISQQQVVDMATSASKEPPITSAN